MGYSKKKTPGINRRDFLSGLGATVLLGLSSCIGQFNTVRLNNGGKDYTPKHNGGSINVAFINIANLRGINQGILSYVLQEDAVAHAKELADIVRNLDVDILCMSEVDYEESIKSGCLNQAKVIAESLGEPYNYALFDSYMQSPVWTIGNAVISRFPVRAVHRHLYGRKKKDKTFFYDKPDDSNTGLFWDRLIHLFKDFIHVEIKVGNKSLNAIVSHFDSSLESNKIAEAKDLLDYVAMLERKNLESYIVAIGDFNSAGGSEPMSLLMSNGILHPPPDNFGVLTYPSKNPKEDLDHIFTTSNIKISDYRTFHFRWSDHKGLVCRIELV